MECKVLVIDGHCFCDWDQPTIKAPKISKNFCKICDDIHNDEYHNEIETILKKRNYCTYCDDYGHDAETHKTVEFKEKIKSINFNRVKGGGRG